MFFWRDLAHTAHKITHLLRFYFAISWHHPRYGVCFYQGKVWRRYGHIPERQVKALQSLDLQKLAFVWVLATAPRSHNTGIRWVFSPSVSEPLGQQMRNLLQSLI